MFLMDRLKDFYKDIKQTILYQAFVLKIHLEYIYIYLFIKETLK